MKTIENLCLLLCFCLPVFLMGQANNSAIGDVVMPAPNAASLGKYGDIPVSTYTGVPSISVPIYTVTEGPLSIPISLSYHASGVKVAEMASWVGLGWSLNAGGMITRTVLGLPDENANGYFDTGGGNSASRQSIMDIGDGTKDGEADIFSFNVGGYSGKFVFDKDQQYHFLPKQDLKLEFQTGSLSEADGFTSFTITVPTGEKYYFGSLPNSTTNTAIETTNLGKLSAPDPNDGTLYNSTWYLVRIESPDGLRKIDFEYVDQYYSYKNVGSCYDDFFACYNGGGGNTGGSSGCSGVFDQNNTHKYLNETGIIGKRLSRIYSSKNNIEFFGTTDREDIDQYNARAADKRLDSIYISSGDYCSKWIFDYDYFKSNSNATKSFEKRLKLNQVQQFSCMSGESIPPYVFTYEGPSNLLPNRYSKDIDHWGFYNGANNPANATNEINIPLTEVVATPTPGGPSFSVVRGSEYCSRESNETFMKHGVLNKIVYPTGGFTEFSYEANRVSAQFVEESPLFQEALSNCIGLGLSCCPSPNTVPFCKLVTTYATPNTAQINSGLEYQLELIYYDENSSANPLCGEEDAEVSIKIFDSQNQLIGSKNLSQCTSPSCIPPPDPSDPPGVIHLRLEGALGSWATLNENEQYRFEMEACNARGVFNAWSDISVFGDRQVGGLRIKQIKSSPEKESSAIDLIKTYEYNTVANPDSSSGRLFQEPIYGYFSPFTLYGIAEDNDGGQDTVNVVEDYVVKFLDASIAPLGSYEGYHIGYDRVVENHNGNGYIEFTYENILESPPLQIPTLPVLLSVEDGKLLSEKVIDQDFNLVKSIENVSEKNYTNLIKAKGLKVQKRATNCGITVDNGTRNMTIYSYTNYTPRTGVYQLRKTESKLDGVTTTTDYEYNGNGHLFPTATTMTNSDGKVHRTETKYTKDANLGGTARTEMLARYMIGYPIQITKKVNGDIVGGQENRYFLFDGHPRLHRQREVYQSGLTLRTMITLDYNAQGNIISVDRRGQPLEMYTWENNLVKTKNIIDWTWKYDYYPGTKMLQKITDLNNIESTFEYDGLSRLSRSTERNGGIFSTYGYDYTLADSGAPNRISSYNSATKQWSYQYFDGLGRDMQSVKKQYSPAHRDVINAVL